MSTTSNPRDPNFDLRTAIPDPRRLASDILPHTDDYDADMALVFETARQLRDRLTALYPDEDEPPFFTVFEEGEGRRVMLGFGFAHNILPEDTA